MALFLDFFLDINSSELDVENIFTDLNWEYAATELDRYKSFDLVGEKGFTLYESINKKSIFNGNYKYMYNKKWHLSLDKNRHYKPIFTDIARLTIQAISVKATCCLIWYGEKTIMTYDIQRGLKIEVENNTWIDAYKQVIDSNYISHHHFSEPEL